MKLEATGYSDEWIEASPSHQGWLFVYWPNNKKGRLSKMLVKRLRQIERQMPGAGFNGWLCNSETDHTEMHRLIESFGARRYATSDGLIWFRKEIEHV